MGPPDSSSEPLSEKTLVHQLLHVVSCKPEVVAQCVGSRMLSEQAEISRIIGHLPVIRELPPKLASRNDGCQSAREHTSQGHRQLLDEQIAPIPRSITPRAPTPRQLAKRRPTPRHYSCQTTQSHSSTCPKSARSDGASSAGTNCLAVKGTPKRRSQSNGRRNASLCTGLAESIRKALSTTFDGTSAASGKQFLEPVCSARSSVRSNFLDCGCPRRPSSAGSNSSASRVEIDSNQVQQVSPPAVGSMSVPAVSQTAKCTPNPPSENPPVHNVEDYYKERLADMGIDPAGMKASDILRLFYARGMGTSYQSMTLEASKIAQGRPNTPICLRHVLTPRAFKEMRESRDLPSTHVHDQLDKWEIDTLADFCRSLLHYEDTSIGYSTEYMRGCGKSVYGHIERKRFVRALV